MPNGNPMDTLEQATIWSQKPYLRLQNPLAKTGRDRTAQWQNENRSTPNPKSSAFHLRLPLVEADGIEPTTSSLQS